MTGPAGDRPRRARRPPTTAGQRPAASARGRRPPAGDAAPETAVGGPAVAVPVVPERPVGLRLARIHVRLGCYSLARAELEALAGSGALDDEALLDLAEVRWRTGDLAGAGEAATALLETGRDEALALVIAAEAVASLGRPGEARRLAGRALAAAGGSLDELFAGQPRNPIWPSDTGVDAAGEAPPVLEQAHPHPGHRRPMPPGTAVAETEVPASPAAAEAFAGGLAALGGGDPATAALRLAVALRLEPAFAESVLEAVGDRAAEPGLALVAGDALRLLGREAEALAAFDVARGHVAGDGLAGDPSGVARDEAEHPGDEAPGEG